VLRLTPAILALLPVPAGGAARKEAPRLNARLAQIRQFDQRYRGKIMVGAAVLVIPCGAGIARLGAGEKSMGL
jgi:hypothetical protein